MNEKNFPVDSSGNLVVNVWDYVERQALYKHLIDNVRHCSWEGTLVAENDMASPDYPKVFRLL